MPKAVIFTGVQASGKTSYYNSFFREYERISLDELKTRNKENKLLQECIASGRDFVSDNTNPTPEDRKKYIDMASSAGYEITGYYFCSEIDKCIARNRERVGKKCVPDVAVAATHRKLVIPSMSEGFDRLYYVRLTENGFVTEEWRENNGV
ncbi:MAG: AAA family ATPase [Huintestinicola sp.]